MKIAHVVSTFFPHQGGMGTVVMDEAMALAERGHSVTVLTMQYPGDNASETKDGLVIKRLQPIIRWGDGGVVSFKKVLQGFDIVHLHAPWYGALRAAAQESRKQKIPFVVTIHMTGRPEGLLKRIFKSLDEYCTNRVVFSHAAKILTVNKDYFATVPLAKKVKDKIMELKNPIDEKIFCPGEKNRSIFGDLNEADAKIILFVGNLLPLKRLDLLLKAVANGENNWRLAVVGGGYAEKKYRQMAKDLSLQAGYSRATNKVKFFGAVERNKLPLFYRSADVVAVPSDTESFSLVAAESLACGTPVVVSNLLSLKEIILSGAVSFKPGDCQDLKTKLGEILNDPPHRQEKLSSRQNFFGLAEHIKNLEQIYQSIT